MILRLASVLIVALAFPTVGIAEPSSAPPTFQIADVHPSPHIGYPFMHGGNLHGDRYELHQASMLDLIATAYNLDATAVQGGPSWLEMDRYDILAKAAPNTSRDDLRLMLRALLADRFKLVAHNGSAPLPAFVLRAGKDKPKMKQSNGSGDFDCQYQNQPNAAPGTAYFACRNATMDQFAVRLHSIAGDYLDSPVINSTGLSGAWDFDLKWTWKGMLQRAGADGVSIFDALDRELGLKLAKETAPRAALIVDKVNESPTPNPPDIEKSLPPPPPAQFEVAVIKPAKPAANLTGSIRGNQVDVHGVTLRFLIYFAWGMNPNDREVLVNAPSWLDSTHFDILAKAAADASDVAGNNPPQIEPEELRQMLQDLLKERFNLKVHNEDRPVAAYTLRSVAPRMAKADPFSRTHCKEGPGPDGKDPRITTPILNRLISCQNFTMAQLADQLRVLANGYIYGDVLDDSGLTGGYDFTLSFSSADRVQGNEATAPAAGNASPSEGGAAASSDPNGAVSLFDAVRRELGLKLEKERRSVPVLVIDHIDDHPTDN
jgi:uncharacterized protein (TIGR03435 family)